MQVGLVDIGGGCQVGVEQVAEKVLVVVFANTLCQEHTMVISHHNVLSALSAVTRQLFLLFIPGLYADSRATVE